MAGPPKELEDKSSSVSFSLPYMVNFVLSKLPYLSFDCSDITKSDIVKDAIDMWFEFQGTTIDKEYQHIIKKLETKTILRKKD